LQNAIKFGIAAAIVIAVIASSLVAQSPGKKGAIAAADNFTMSASAGQAKILRIGYFPNISHAQAVIGFGTGDFQKMLGRNITVQTQIFNAGPSAIEALFGRQIDVAYIGPNPTINGYIRSDGQGLKIISGVASGGADFVVRTDAGIHSVKDFSDKKFGAPQLGNTQDVALRKYLQDNGYKTAENGGNVTIIDATSAHIFTLIVNKQLDGAWVPEPWGAKLVDEANCTVFVDERTLWPHGDFVTAQIIVNPDYLTNNPDVIKKLLKAHVNETNWINQNPDEAMLIFNTQLVTLTGKAIPQHELKEGFSRLKLTYDPVKDSLYESANTAFDIGLLGSQRPDLTKPDIYDLSILNQVLVEDGLRQVN